MAGAIWKSRMSLPSMKNGRFSEKNVSNSVRFTSEGSASTWPKSGFKVKSRVRSLVTPSLPSSPAPTSVSEPSWNGSPSTASLVVTSATV